MRIVFDYPLSSGPCLQHSFHRERFLMQAPNGTIERGARQASEAGHEGKPSSPQLFRIEGSDKMLLALIKVRKQQSVFRLKFVRFVHSNQYNTIPSICHDYLFTGSNCRSSNWNHVVCRRSPWHSRVSTTTRS